jgi:hypothetical protein
MTETANEQGDPRQDFGFGIHEIGVHGSVLEQTRALVDETVKPTLGQVELRDGETAHVLLEHDGFSVIDPDGFNDYRAKPLFYSGTAELGDLDSLIAYTNRHKDDCSVVFADDDRKAPTFTSVLDYHSAGGPASGGQRFGRHQARHALPLSDEWKAWADLNSEPITMPNFARFLEDHIIDVMPPGMIELSEAQEKFVAALGGSGRIADPAKLMELATGLRIYEEAQVSQATNLQSGEGELILTSTHSDGQGGKLLIGELYQIVVRLRYRKTGAGIVFVYELWRDALVFDHAFNEAVQRVREETSLTVYRGTRGNS